MSDFKHSFVEVKCELVVKAAKNRLEEMKKEIARDKEFEIKSHEGKRKFWFGPKRTRAEAEEYVKKLEKDANDCPRYMWLYAGVEAKCECYLRLVKVAENGVMFLSIEDAAWVESWAK